MVMDKEVSVKKVQFVQKVTDLFVKYDKFIIFNADKVGATQMKKIRATLFGKAEMQMGKNTLFRKACVSAMDKRPALQRILNYLVGNVGFLFTNDDLYECRKELEILSEMTPAKVGTFAQCDVFIYRGPTAVPPEKTSFFQSLNISTMINKGFIDIMSDIHLIKAGAKIGESEVALLSMLKIVPFAYKLQSLVIYDNECVYLPEILDVKPEDFVASFKQGLSSVSALALGLGHPTKCSLNYAFMDAFRSVVGLSMVLEHENKYTEMFKTAMENSVAIASTQTPIESKKEAVEAPKAEEPEEESEADMGFGLFD